MKLLRSFILLLIAFFIFGCTTQNPEGRIFGDDRYNDKVGRDFEGEADYIVPNQAESSKSVAKERAQAPAVAASESKRLGTQWGEGVQSSVTTVDLRRVSSKPMSVMQMFYSAVAPKGRSVNEIMFANGRIGVSVLNDWNRQWPLTQVGKNTYLKGKEGERYQLSYRNYSTRTYEIVVSVDGLDVLNGSKASVYNTGYVLYPLATLKIEGFRKSQHEVAAFRFSAVEDSYAANTPAGSARNTGVIGTAVFELYDPNARQQRYRQPDTPQAFPGDNQGNEGYAPPPYYK